jgi:acyl carrier protein
MSQTLEIILQIICEETQKSLGQKDSTTPFVSLGLTSIQAYSLAAKLERKLEQRVTPLHFFNFPTPQKLADKLDEEQKGDLTQPDQQADSLTFNGLQSESLYQKSSRTQNSATSKESIVIVGEAHWIPGSNSRQRPIYRWKGSPRKVEHRKSVREQ